ncbi:MAG: hypothetical protein E3K40_13085 [Candidatus Brocadia sp.]|nr:hypothetical protein [Candidatus Brocadia sp.]MDG6027617.1 hypothetical protein [Candidatus Brocadia sp.]
MQKQKIPYTLCDNAFFDMGGFQKTHEIANGFSPEQIHTILDEFSRKYCPFLKEFHLSYHGSVLQIEHATDIVFRQQSYSQTLYNTLTRTAIPYILWDKIIWIGGCASLQLLSVLRALIRLYTATNNQSKQIALL